MPFLPASGSREIAWKNGGGFTREIAAYPAGSGYEDFVWRVSLARIASDGPFSQFPGVDRLFAIVDGSGVWLERAGAAPLHLDRLSAPFGFPGEWPIFARLDDGEVVALNVMTRRDVVVASLELLDIEVKLTVPAAAGIWLALALDGACLIETPERDYELQRGDAWLHEGGKSVTVLLPHPKVRVVLLRIV